jgi:hypothetical protein
MMDLNDETPARPACAHIPACPTADAADRDAAHVVSAHPEQGWSLLCNGVVVFDDTGEILPDGSVIDPHRPEPRAHSHVPSAA